MHCTLCCVSSNGFNSFRKENSVILPIHVCGSFHPLPLYSVVVVSDTDTEMCYLGHIACMQYIDVAGLLLQMLHRMWSQCLRVEVNSAKTVEPMKMLSGI